MPAIALTYSNTVIYAIKCRDKSIKDFYIGHTASYSDRIRHHKKMRVNSVSKKNKLYQCIDKHGGFDNWNFEVLETASLQNLTEAIALEQKWINKLKPTLNAISSVFVPYDLTVIDLSSVKEPKERGLAFANFRKIKEQEELVYLRKENKRLKQELLNFIINKTK